MALLASWMVSGGTNQRVMGTGGPKAGHLGGCRRGHGPVDHVAHGLRPPVPLTRRGAAAGRSRRHPAGGRCDVVSGPRRGPFLRWPGHGLARNHAWGRSAGLRARPAWARAPLDALGLQTDCPVGLSTMV